MVNRENQNEDFQDPQVSLNPRMKVGDIIAEGLDAYRLKKGSARKQRIIRVIGEGWTKSRAC